MSIGLSILAFFVVLGPLIFFHELGHFLAARWSKIEVEEFGIGYPPRMLTLFKHQGTKYTLNWLPLGGFMRPKGEDDPGVEGGLAAAPKRARLAVLFAGPVANILVAFLLLVIMFMLGAPVEQAGAEVVRVEPNTPAEKAGLQEGDIILYADDMFIEQYEDLIFYINEHVGQAIVLTIQREGERLNAEVMLRTDPPEGQGPAGIQIRSIVEVRSYGPFAATGKALGEMGELLRALVELPSAIIQQRLPPRYLRPVSFIGISQLGGQAIDASLEQNAAWPIVQITAFVSLALAITNLLPIPAFDGGRILFVLIEAVRGKRVNPQRETLIHFVGFAIMLMAMIIFVYLDIVDPLILP